MKERVARVGDLWAGLLERPQSIAKVRLPS
jgi:hypothetical protein